MLVFSTRRVLVTFALTALLSGVATPVLAMQISIRLLTGQSFTLDVQPSDTIESVKQQIQVVRGTPTNQQRLIFTGRQLEDGRTLADYNVVQDSRVFLVIRQSSSSAASSETDGGIPMWFQSVGRTAGASCPQGWNPSWAQWPNAGSGGWTCDRLIPAYSSE